MDNNSKSIPLNVQFNLVSDLLDYMVEHYPQKGHGYIASNGTEVFYTYPEIKDRALKVLDCLQKNGIKQGDIISVETEEVDIFHTMFWACMYGGIIISSIQAPASWDIHSKSVDIFMKQLNKLEMPVVITQKSHESNYEELKSLNDNLSILIFENLVSDNYGICKKMQPDDIVYIQFSSGTTGVPEGAMLSNKNIIFSCHVTAINTKLNEDDIVFSWLPHTHNLGLFAPLIIAMMLGNSGYFMKPGAFLQNPLLFFKKIDEHRGTWFSTNNFGLEWMIQKIPESSIDELDLHSIKSIFAGAENITQNTIDRFSHKFASCGINQKLIRPGYGMTEATLVVSLTKMSTGPVIECISRKSMMHENKAVLTDSSNTNDAVFYTGNGVALNGIDLRIVDDNHEPLPDHIIGEVEVKGNCLFREYYNEPEATANKMHNGWLQTGDLGYLSNEQLFIVGRKKDIAVIRGVNYVITDIEECICNNVGIPKAIFAVASVMHENQEELVVFVQYKESIEKFVELYKKIHSIVLEYYQMNLNAILPIQLIPKTATGKVMRYMLKMQYENGMFQEVQDKVESVLHMSDRYSDVDDSTDLKSEIEMKVLDCWSEILHIPTDKIPVYKTFSSMGGNSIQAYQLLMLLSKTFNVDLGQEVIAKYDTVSKMVHYLKNFSHEKEETVYTKNTSEDKIVITGIAFRLPEADTQEKFWSNLKDSHDSIKRVSDKRKTLSKSSKWNDWIGEVENIDSFDYDFFDMTYDEAKFMDPQQRLAMETAYEALEDAGMIQDEFETESVGVYACVCENSYEPIVFNYIDKNGYDDVPPRTLVNNMHNMIAARISHQYGFTGPVMAIDSACSSFMTAVHVAKSTILNGDIEGAVIIGTNLIANEYIYGLVKN
ncbi:MAG: AMP-binding protein, partial [Ruminococcus sp.]|nr:AMP-binding protein [Ruminococcus sp.]